MNNVDYFYNVDSSMFQNVKLEKNKDSYVVTGTFNAVDNFADVDYILDNIIGDSTEFDNYVATLTFDKKTKQIEQMEMTASNDDVNEFTIVVTFNEIGSDFDVSVPDDILNSATEFISNTDEAINGYEDNETGYDDAYTYDGQVVNGSSNSSNVTNSGANGTASTTETASNSSSNKTSNGTSAQNDTTNTGSTNSSGSTSNKTSSISSNLALYETISGNDIGGTSETHPYEKEKEEIVVVEEPEEAPVEVEQPKNTIGYALLGKTTITNKEASSLMNGRIPEVSDVTDRVTYICNTFTKEEYLGYVGVWEGMDSDSKNAVVWIAECTNIASINDIINAGANENEVNKILKEIR
jgi:hypothetical protein